MRFIASLFMLLALTVNVRAADDPIAKFFNSLAPKAEREFRALEPQVKRFRRSVESLSPGRGGQHVRATYYNCCKRTANGESFNPHGMTAAHKSLPFGTRVHVTNPKNGRSVTVRINDRGPFTRGYSYDLAQGAARAIGFSSGPIIATIVN